MEISANNCVNFKEIYCAVNNFKMINTEKKLTEIFNKISDNKNLNYIGELNKNDVMF
jgi:predicted regulator of amino acid metabolism with ACT domain